MLRGNNKQQIFEDDDDENKFTQLLRRFRFEKREYYHDGINDEIDIPQYRVLAWCLMGNHVHLLIKTEEIGLATIVRKIGTAYAQYYNKKYKHGGHVFQGRFRSEPVDNDEYLMTAFRYIHRNPVKAGICKTPEEYKKSSYAEYFSRRTSKICDTSIMLGLMKKSQLKKFVNEKNDDVCLDIDEKGTTLTDKEAGKLIKKTTGMRSAADFTALDPFTRDEILSELINTRQMSLRQISRLTGISYGVVQKQAEGAS